MSDLPYLWKLVKSVEMDDRLATIHMGRKVVIITRWDNFRIEAYAVFKIAHILFWSIWQPTFRGTVLFVAITLQMNRIFVPRFSNEEADCNLAADDSYER